MRQHQATCNLRAASTPGSPPKSRGKVSSFVSTAPVRDVSNICLMQELWSKASPRHISDCHSTASKLTHSAASASDWAGQRAVSQHQHSHLSLACSADLWCHSLGCTQLITFPHPICLHTSSHPCLAQVFSGICSLTSYHLHRILTPIFPCCLTKLMECSLPASNTTPLVGDLSRTEDFWDICWKVP